MRMNSQFDGNRADFGWSKRACTTNKKHWIDVFDECRQAGHDFSDGSVAQRKWYQTFKNYNMGRDGGEVMPLSLRDESSFCIQVRCTNATLLILVCKHLQLGIHYRHA
uniref:Uncharacterized protein n=1 Tax=Physcomitrium patens TaxID=3218 RepID=A0A7I4F5D2_PHYPA